MKKRGYGVSTNVCAVMPLGSIKNYSGESEGRAAPPGEATCNPNESKYYANKIGFHAVKVASTKASNYAKSLSPAAPLLMLKPLIKYNEKTSDYRNTIGICIL